MAVDNKFRLMTAIEAEDELGKKYFYRQKTYRYEQAGRLRAFAFRSRQCFLPNKLLQPYIEDLRDKLKAQFPELRYSKVFYDDATRRMVIDGIFGRYIAADTDTETEADLLKKIASVREWLMEQDRELEKGNTDEVLPFDLDDEVVEDRSQKSGVTSLVPSIATSFPDSIMYVRVDTAEIEGVSIKSFVMISMPSIAQFIGVKTDQFTEWINQTTFAAFILSAHYKQIQGPEFSGPWKKGSQKGLTAFLPLELIPELLVAFKQSNRSPAFPARAEQLYMMARSTLEAVGLSISGNHTLAAKELAKVSEGLGISAADQVIEIFKRYESRSFQVETNRKFRGKVVSSGKDIKETTGRITFGVTGQYPGAWKALGESRRLPVKHRSSGREAMRALSPSNSVGVTFSESHYIKDPNNLEEVIKTGKQGKDFYERLKEVGLLDD